MSFPPIREVPWYGKSDRIETGPVKFGDDWPGLFIRGDDSFGMRQGLEQLLARIKKADRLELNIDPKSLEWFNEVGALDGIVALLKSCDMTARRAT